jgi:hypothetical protein
MHPAVAVSSRSARNYTDLQLEAMTMSWSVPSPPSGSSLVAFSITTLLMTLPSQSSVALATRSLTLKVWYL